MTDSVKISIPKANLCMCLVTANFCFVVAWSVCWAIKHSWNFSSVKSSASKIWSILVTVISSFFFLFSSGFGLSSNLLNV
jgi:steroid 5-alpha reductase family enzyme